MYRHSWFILLCFILNRVNCANILTLIPTPSISHQIPHRALTEALVKRGHHITLLTTDPVEYDRDEYENLTQIDVKDISYKIFTRNENFVDLNKWFPTSIYIWYFETMLEYAEAQLNTPEMQKLLKNPNQKFDLCFLEVFAPPMMAVKDRFNCSLIMISSSITLIDNFDAVGNPSNPILYPDLMNPYLKPYTFIQKLIIVFQDVYYRYIYYYMYLSRMEALAKKHFGEDIRPILEIERDIDMIFLNDNPITGNIRPTVPSIVYMNGLHLKSNTSLPLKYQKILDEAVNGVIYFSLGSNVKSVDLPLNKRNEFLDAFNEIPYTVLWKWENDTLDNKPSNVIVSKWMPQQDILAHPNIKAFITQGGQQSMEEAIHHKIPLIGLPFIGDQLFNVNKMVKLGIGEKLFHETLSKKTIIEAIEKVVKNPEYKERISKISDLINDQPQSALERTVWWTEYVLRHKGASHLRAPAIEVPFYEYFLLDIIGFVLGCLLLLIFIGIKLLKILIRTIVPIRNSVKYRHEKNQ